MQVLNLIQGTPEWLAARTRYFTASEAAAMLGFSKHQTRSELLKQKATGLVPDADPMLQRIFAKGHAAEAAARPWIEKRLGEELYPCTGALEVNGLPLLASFDGISMDQSTVWEHKLLNNGLKESVLFGVLEPHYWPQLEQQLLVSGAEYVIFTCSDGTEESHASTRYTSVPERRAQLIAGWHQFKKDLDNYTHVATKELPLAEVVAGLPALFIHAKGEITTSNIAEYGDALALQLQSMRSIVLITDQDFSNAKASAKHLRTNIDQAKAAKESMLASTLTVGQAAKMIDTWCEDMRVTALQLEKDVEREDMLKKQAIVQEVKDAFAAHFAALNNRLGKPYMPAVQADFAGVIKGKRSYTSMQDAVDTELARVKIETNAVADKIQTNLTTLRELAKDHDFLFLDANTIALKAPDDLTALVKNRISEFTMLEEKRLEAERAQIRAEEVAKLEKAATEAARIEAARIAKEAADAAHAERLAAEQREQERRAEIAAAALQAIMQAKAPDDAKATAEAAKPEPIALTLVAVAPLPAKIVVTPVQTSTHADIVSILDTLSEADLIRTLHFVQTRFCSEMAA